MTATKKTKSEVAQPDMNLLDAINTIADHFSNEIQIVDRNTGEVRPFNTQFFSCKDIVQSLHWKAETRLTFLHQPETEDYRSGMKRPNMYGLPYRKAVAEKAVAGYLNGSVDDEAKADAINRYEQTKDEITNLMILRKYAAQVADERFGIVLACKDHDTEAKPRVTANATKIDRETAIAEAKALGLDVSDQNGMDNDATEQVS